MHLCYVDESGTPDVPGTSSHFVLAGIALPISEWKKFDSTLFGIMSRYDLGGKELHTAWILRKYIEQSRIPDFETMQRAARRAATHKVRVSLLLAAQKAGNNAAYRQMKKTYAQTSDYIHLSLNDRKQLVLEVAQAVSGWQNARLFAECIDKAHFDPTVARRTISEQAFEQVVSRFEQFLKNSGKPDSSNFGLIVHDNNPTVAHKHTELMRHFHEKGTLWTGLKRIIETPMFVDSKLTGMVQIADLCSYALRRYVENGETELFSLVLQRADRIVKTVVGVRHFTGAECECLICIGHRKPK
ncbi:MAG TPA: DUF3800 domain-containing protein [Acidobacteriaceae bacterium]